MKRSHRVYDVVKRTLDIAFSAVLLLVASPLMLAVSALVLVSVGRPVLFSQRRPGRNGRIFTIHKFRTMVGPTPGTDDLEAVKSDVERLTRIGRFLRATSLDELPQVWNVLVGDMSLVGPRPLLVAYLERYNSEQARRHEVRPGITGWAQVNGRNAIGWPERLEMDVWYVDHRSLALDARILAMTVRAALTGRGVTANGSATVEPFSPSAADESHKEEL